MSESAVFVDLLPLDGMLRAFTPEEEFIMGQGLERLVERSLKLKTRSTMIRLPCSAQTTPEALYVSVAHAVRACIQARREASLAMSVMSQAPAAMMTTSSSAASRSSTSPPRRDSVGSHAAPSTTVQPPEAYYTTFVLILQDIERAPTRTLACVSEMLATKFLSAPPSTTILVPGVAVDRIDLPSPFVLLATSTTVPTTSWTGSLVSNAGLDVLPDRLLERMLLRIPVFLPRAQAPQPVAATNLDNFVAELRAAQEMANNAFCSPAIARYVRDALVALKMHPCVERGPSIETFDVVLQALKNNAGFNKRGFVVPLDVELVLVEMLAHRIVVRDDVLADGGLVKAHKHSLARRIVGHVLENLPVLR